MFIVLLRFTENRSRAPQFMESHKAWLQQGFDEGVFQLAGSLQPQAGGAVLAHATSMAALQARVAQDPFVEHGIVSPDILEITPSRSVPALAFLGAAVAS